MPLIITILCAFGAYCIGSISSAIIVCKLMRLPDPRTQGSGNPGATNVLRLGGKKAALIALLGDLLKGLLPVLVAQLLGFSPLTVAIVAFSAFLGHLYPVFFNFHGGKGVATALGAILALSWPTGLTWIVTWLIVAIFSRYSSLAALTASVLAPVYIWFFTHNDIYVATLALMSCLLIARHRTNIEKLLAGTENKIGQSRA